MIKYMVLDEYGDLNDVLTGDIEHYKMLPLEAFNSYLGDHPSLEGKVKLVLVDYQIVT